jgi:hypothetical protein
VFRQTSRPALVNLAVEELLAEASVTISSFNELDVDLLNLEISKINVLDQNYIFG